MATDPREYFPTSINIGNYIPSLDDIQNSALTLKSTVVDIVKGRNNNSGLAVHTVTYMKFEEWTLHNQTHYYLIVGTSTGFQVFLLHDSRDREQNLPLQQTSSTNLNTTTQSIQSIQSPPNTSNSNININIHNSPIINPLTPLMNGSPHQSPSFGAVSSKRKKFHKKALVACDNLEIIKVAPGGGKQQRQINNPISCATILKQPYKWEGPIIAVSPANEAHNFDSKCVRLYSLMEQQYVHVYRLRTRVHGIFSRPNALIMVTSKEIVVINPMTDEKLYRKSCAPNPINGVVAALGNRWLAFADIKLRQTQIGTHILPRNKHTTNNNYTSLPLVSSFNNYKNYKNYKKKKAKNKYKKNKKNKDDEKKSKNNKQMTVEHNKINTNNDDDDDEDFGTLGVDNKLLYDEELRNERNERISMSGYELMTSQLFNASDQISKTVSNTMSAVSVGTMNFIKDSFVETRKEVSKQVKKQQNNIKRKRHELRQKDENNNYNNYKASINSYCDEPPKHGIISIIDVIKGELLINFIAHPNCPLMYIAFDPSGTLLVTADRDGIYLNVFQVIGFPIDSDGLTGHKSHKSHNKHVHDAIIDNNYNYNNEADNDNDNNNKNVLETTVYRHLYRIYRGFRYAIIRDITFSKDSKWMAVSSARGTIHIYAINREGGMATYITHNILPYASYNSYDSYECIDINKIYDLQSEKKLHHEMQETRKDPMGTNTTSGGTKIVSTFSHLGCNAMGTQSLFVETPVAFHQYCIHTSTSTNTNTDPIISINQEKAIYLKIEHLHKFTSRDLYNAQSVSYPYLHDQLYPQTTPTNTNTNINTNKYIYNQMSSITMSIFNLDEQQKQQKQPTKQSDNNNNNINDNDKQMDMSASRNYDEDTKRWLSNTELCPINRFHEVSLWGNPQFNFYSYPNIQNTQNMDNIEEEKEEKEEKEDNTDIDEYEPAEPGAARVKKKLKEDKKHQKKQREDVDMRLFKFDSMKRNVSNESQCSMNTVDITPEPLIKSNNSNNNNNNNNNNLHKSDPYSFLDIKHIENAIPIKLHEHSPIIGPRINQPQIQVTISDLQQTIDSAMGTIIDQQKENNDKNDNDNNDNNDNNYIGDIDRGEIPIPLQQTMCDKSKSIESNDSNNDNDNDNILPLHFDEIYIKNESNDINQIDDDNVSTDSDDFQLVD